ncbi:hypothetical protein [Nocardioides sp.]|uniref:hypothetical protein n=1 Tax=Nocardioides sp. TaxID=35761 RepID=UPI002718188B|nr:hypothetical protein [Nocardioides sp.]MDO9457746.1 hypothetical protein [Nocardioides sp.]
MEGPERPLTEDGVLAWARSLSDDPDAVVRYRHPFDGDLVHGGLACVDGERLWFASYDGGFGSGYLSHGDTDETLDRAWEQARHAARDLDWSELGPWQRAAVTALALGTTVSALPPQHRVGIESDLDRDWADWLWIQLRRGRLAPMRTLAARDHLLEAPVEASRAGRRTHACPLCGLPAPHQERYPRAVCDDCTRRAVAEDGRPVRGYNTSLGGGFQARYADGDDGTDGEVCDEVTRTGRVTVSGKPCSMGEARFGGVVVEAL